MTIAGFQGMRVPAFHGRFGIAHRFCDLARRLNKEPVNWRKSFANRSWEFSNPVPYSIYGEAGCNG